MNRINFILIYFLLAFIAYADPGNKARSFDIRDGLPSNNLSTVGQDDKGLIWIGTWNGLSFFNGERFFTFRSDNSRGSLSTNRILGIMPDSLDNVWFTTYDSKLNLFDKDNGCFIAISEFFPNGTVLPNIRHLYRSKNHIWGLSPDRSKVIKIDYSPDSDYGYKLSLLNTSDIVPNATLMLGVINSENGDSWIVTDESSILENGEITVNGKLTSVVDMGSYAYLVMSDGKLYSYTDNNISGNPSLKDFGDIKTSIRIDNSRIGVATSKGYATYNVKTREWTKYGIEGGVDKIASDSNMRIWIFSGKGDIMMAQGGSAPSAVPIDMTSQHNSNFHNTNFVAPVIFEDPYGTIWLAPKNKCLSYYDENKSRIVSSPVLLPSLKYTALPIVEKYFTDRSGDMWLISSSGLSFVNFTYQNSKNLPVDENHETRSVLVTQDGSILAGAASGALSKYGPDGTFMGYLTHTPITEDGGHLTISPSYSNFSNKIYALAEDSYGNLWVGTKGDGLYTISPQGKVFNYSPKFNDSRFIVSDVIYDFDIDSRGRLWIATYDNGPLIASMNHDGSASFTTLSDIPNFPDGESFKQIRRITHNDSGEIVMSTNAGIIILKDDFNSPDDISYVTVTPDSSDKEGISAANVMQTLFTKSGYVLISPMGGEVQRIDGFDLEGKKFRFHKPASDELSRILSRDNVQSMIEDDEGNLYFVRDADIVRYCPADSAINILGSNVFGDDYEFTEGLPVKDAEGNLYFCAVGNVVKLHPQSINKYPDPPKIIFTSMQVPEKGQESTLIPNEKIVIEPGNRDFSLSFTSIDYSGTGRTEYAYKFGKDHDWTFIGTDNTIRISGLSPGIHRLYIKSTNVDGTWCDNEEYIDIDVRPKFSESIWAKILWIIFFLILIGAAVWMYISHRQNRLMSQMHKREHDFYVNASHKLRTPLSLIGSPVYEVMKTENLSDTGRMHLERVRRNAKDMLEVLNTMLKAEFKPSGLYDSDTAEMGYSELPAYMTSENWLEAKDDGIIDKNQDITILIVEDNDDLRGFLHDILQSQYNILTASNGKEGLAIAESGQPDFILTDVTMPEMDGLTMVKKIKSHGELSHIPIIVLSAKTSIIDKMEGLRAGIDDYISKPFSATYLRQRIANIIAQRAMLQRSFMEKLGSRMNQSVDNALSHSETIIPVSESSDDNNIDNAERQEYRLSAPQIIEEDHLMMEKLMKFVEEKISDENLKIEDMADAVGLGRTVFYSKIKAITGMAPSDFLRTLRMQRAEELIVRSNLTFSQVSFSIGFSDPKYFTKCFKKETGMTPSEYRKQKRSSEDNG